MKDTADIATDPPRALRVPRAEGAVRVSARLRRGESRLAEMRQQGSAKVFFPRHPGARLEGVLLNTAGGITGGDRFRYDAAAGPGAALSLSTQAAERVYRAVPPARGRVEARLDLSEGAALDWLPQETILFDGGALERRMEVDMAPCARLLMVEPLVFGRLAMGERCRTLHFTDHWRIRRGGALVYADAVRIVGDAEAMLMRRAVAGGARAVASLLYVAPDAADRLTPLRARLPDAAGASVIRDGVLSARILAPDGYSLRRALTPALECLRGAPLPKVWTL